MKAVNRKRRASEFSRAYGSVERVRTLKMRPCDGCGRVPTEECPNQNAHTEGGGAGRKAGWQTVVTLCMTCHGVWHHLGSTPAFDEAMGTNPLATAARLATEITA